MGPFHFYSIVTFSFGFHGLDKMLRGIAVKITAGVGCKGIKQCWILAFSVTAVKVSLQASSRQVITLLHETVDALWECPSTQSTAAKQVFQRNVSKLYDADVCQQTVRCLFVTRVQKGFFGVFAHVCCSFIKDQHSVCFCSADWYVLFYQPYLHV